MPQPLFRDLTARLIERINQRVRAGAVSERGLARLTGYSQPHMHNVLHGVRGITLALADELLQTLGLPATALLDADELAGHAPPDPTGDAAVPLLDGLLGAGRPYPRLGASAGRRLFPARVLLGLGSPVAADLHSQERSMWPTLCPGDQVLLDCAPAARRRPSFEHVYAVNWRGSGYVARCRKVGARLALVVENDRAEPQPPAWVSLEKDRGVLDVIQGRVVWIGRFLEPSGGPD